MLVTSNRAVANGGRYSGTRRSHDASLLDRLVRRTVARSAIACSGVSMICQGMPLASCFPVSRPLRSQSNMICGVMPMAAYDWWMQGEKNVRPGRASRHVVKLADGTVLNRYWDERAAPRDESYKKDMKDCGHIEPAAGGGLAEPEGGG